jgi:hypothetical protein
MIKLEHGEDLILKGGINMNAQNSQMDDESELACYEKSILYLWSKVYNFNKYRYKFASQPW